MDAIFGGMFSTLGVVAGITSVGIFAIVIIAIIRKDRDNAALYTAILGFLAPTIVTLLALAQVQVTSQKVDALEIKVDGRLTRLLQITEEAAQAKGELIGRDQIKSEVKAEAEKSEAKK